MIKRLRRNKIAKSLDALIDKATNLKDGSPDKHRRLRDYLTDSENREYTRLARKHSDLSRSIGDGKEYDYFSVRMDAYSGENSPKGLLSVAEDTSTKISWKWDEELGFYVQLINGRRHEDPRQGSMKREEYQPDNHVLYVEPGPDAERLKESARAYKKEHNLE